ncbi:MAG: hypothetical protein SPD96_07425 [Paludibacteraceae bacterium]|nr:hypothetical protein [Paludibacteraceae bacterium]
MATTSDIRSIIDYIKQFLLYGNAEAAHRVGYTADEQEWEQYPVVIVPNGFLGNSLVLPDMERPQMEKHGKTLVIRTDLIYNTFFFISRAEELLNRQRDEHGRFCSRYSILGYGNRLQIPIIDEYAHILMKHLELDMPAPRYSHIYLTHDIDTISQYRHVRGFLGGIYRGEWRQALQALTDIHNDPVYTFPWLIEQDAKVPTAKVIYFVKHTRGKGYDYPQYNLQGADFQHLKTSLLKSGARLGIHSSYYGVDNGLKITDTRLNSSDFRCSETKVTSPSSFILHPSSDGSILHRSHYLRCSIDNMQALADAGVTDDFTMAFPDQAGFRLQTARPVRWINPKTYTLTPLTLHPLTVMDCTLSNTNYMNLQTEDEAYFFCEQLFDKVRQYAGDITLLWHNSIFKSNTTNHNNESINYHTTLYPKLLKGLRHYSKHQ